MSKKSKNGTKAKLKIPFSFKPVNLSFTEWQTALRKQIAKETMFEIEASTSEVYTDYFVKNVVAKNEYRVALRSQDNSRNFCACLDFKTNQLGTCKHIEAVFNFINRKPQLKKQLKLPYLQTYSSIYLDYRGNKTLRFRIGTDNSDALSKALKPYIYDQNILSDSFVLFADKIIPELIQISPNFKCYDDAMDYVIAARENSKRTAFIDGIRGKNALPRIDTLKAKLFPYQKEGVRFIVKAGKCILADDMGLGKTLQAIAAAQLYHQYFGVQNVLIICPTSLKYQWQTEIEKFTKSKSLVIEGNPARRNVQYQSAEFLYKIVSYHSAVNDIAFINKAGPDLIILDEAQRIKNWQTKISSNIKKLQSPYKLVLTGTPVENKIQDLYSLIQFIRPTDLESLINFSNKYEKKDDNGKVIGYQNLDEVALFIKPFLLRRRKSEVLHELPSRTDKNILVALTPEQREIHDSYLQEISKIVSKWKAHRFLREEDRKKLMILLGMMRMVCNSTFIIDQQTNYQTKLDELFNVLEQIWESSDEKVVIFSQWERFTRLIAAILTEKGVQFASLNGNVASKDRKDLFDEFNNNPNCKVFLSTDAGGVGLNLQAGSYVINMDMPWNPAVLEQRIARVYRYGQTKNVSVINFVAQHTIEHGMLSRLKFKSALAAGILDNGEPNIFMNEEQSKSFMQSVSDLIDTDVMQETVYAEEAVRDINEVDNEFDVEEMKYKQDLDELYEFDDEDLLDYDTPVEITQSTKVSKGNTSVHEGDNRNNQQEENTIINTNDFVQQAASFFSNLSSILSDEKATQDLVQSVCKKDETTGQTYLQIPVEDESVIKNMLGLFAGLLSRK